MPGNRSPKCIATWALLVVAGLAWAGTAAAGTVTGTVKDAVTNAALQGVTVKVTQQTSKTATTNSSGVYSIASVTAGTVTLTATKTNYVDYVTGNIVVPASGTVTAPLILLQSKGTITGTVVSSVGGAAVSGATVKITGTSTSVSTATNGTFTLYAATGTYTLTITKTGWVTKTTASFSVTNGQATALGSIPFVQNGTLTGTVVNANGGAVVASAKVTVTGTSTYANTNTSGVYTLTTGAGPVTLTVTKTGWLTATTGSVTVVGGVTTTVPAIQLTQLATVTGTVKEQGTNTNVQGVTVTLQSDPTKTATTSSSGVFSISSVPGGSQSFDLVKAGYQSRSAGPFTISGTSTNVGTILLTKAAGTITGVVRDAGAGNAALADATVTVNGVTPTISGTSNGDGSFTLANVPAGSQSVHVTRDGYVAADSTVVTVQVGQTVSVGYLPLARVGVTISGVVRSTLDGSPIAGATLTVDEQPARTTTTASDGAYALSDVTWGLVHLTVSHPSYTSQTREVDLGTGGSVQEFDLEVGRGHIAGTVLDAVTGLAMSDVWVRPEGQPDFNAGTDWQGSFTLQNLPVGTYRVLLSREGYTDGAVENVEVSTGQTTTVATTSLQPRPCTITGVVRNPDLDQTLEGVTVTLARSGETTVSGADGTYSFAGVQPGREVIAFRKDGYSPTVADELWLGNGATTERSGELRPQWGAVTLTLRGVVRDSADLPVEGAEVAVVGGPPTTSDATGSYTLSVPRGIVVLRASKAGYQVALSRPLGGACFYFDSPCQGLHDFVLPATGETATIAAVTTDPVTLAARQGGLNLATTTAAIVGLTGPDGSRLLPGLAPGPLLGWVAPRTLLPGQTIALDFHGPATIPEAAPRWAAAGLLTRATTGEPVIGAHVTLSNPGASFSQDVLTNAAGRWSFSSGPEGHYVVEAWTDEGLHTQNTWEFDAADDQGLRIGDLSLVATEDRGSLTIETPTNGAPISTPFVTVSCEATLPHPDDHVAAVWADISNGSASNRAVTFGADGRHFEASFEAAAPNGTQTITVSVLTRRDTVLQATVDVSFVVGPTLSSLTLAAAEVLGGGGVEGQATLSEPAPAGGTVVQLASSNPAVASVPESVTVPEGQTSATFPVTTYVVTVPTTVQLSGVASGATRTTSLLVDSRRVAGLGLDPSSILGGTAGSGTVTLNAPAPAGGLAVALTSANPGVATVPASVDVPEGATSAVFAVATTAVAASTGVDITATAGGGTATATLTVGPLAVSALTVAPSEVIGGGTAQATVTLNGPAPAGGSTVTLQSADPTSVAVPPTVLVPEGASSATFTATSASVTATVEVSISATLGASSQSATLTVHPLAVASLTAQPAQVLNGGATVLAVTLNGAAPAGGVTVALTSSDLAAVPVPAQVEIPAGQTTASVQVTVATVSAATTATLTASANGSAANVAVTVHPVSIAAVSFSSAVVQQGYSLNFSISLTGPAPAGGVSFAVTSSRPDLWAPSGSIHIGAGSTSSGTSGAIAGVVEDRTPVTVTVTGGGLTAVATADIVPPGIESMSFAQNPVYGGAVTSLTLNLYRRPPAALSVTLTSSDPATATVPAQVMVPANNQSYQVSVTTHAQAAGKQVLISATAAGRTRTATLTVQGPGTLTGTLAEQAAGTPVPGATVSLAGTSTTTTSDAAGAFSFELAPGSYTLVINKTGLATTAAGPFTVVADETVSAGTIAMLQGGVISGTIADSSCAHQPAYPVSIAVDGTVFATQTDGSGAFAVSLAPGTYTLTLSGYHYATTQSGPVTVTAGQTTSEFFSIDRYNRVIGRAVDSVTGQGIADVVVVGQNRGVTDSDTTLLAGGFAVDLPPGTGTLTLTKSGYLALSRPLNVTNCEWVELGDQAMTLLGSVVGSVVSAADQTPIGGALVQVVGRSGAATTSPTGTFSLSDVPGTFSLRITAPGWAPRTVGGVTITAAQTTELGAITLNEGGTVAGTVVSSVDATPVPGVTITAAASGDAVQTDGLGAFTLLHQPEGSTTLTLSKVGWDPGTAGPFTVSVGATTDVGLLQLTPRGTVRGTVVDASTGAPLSGVTATLTGTSVTTVTDSQGVFSIVHTGGHITLSLARAGWAPVTTPPFTIEAAGTTDLGTVPMSQMGAIHGRITGATGFVRVEAVGTGVSALTTAEFTLSLPPGSYELDINRDGNYRSLPLRTPAFVVLPGQTTETGDLALPPAGAITVLVQSPLHGFPLAGASVTAVGTEWSTTSSLTSYYPIDGANAWLTVPPGTYTVEVRLQGFLTETRGPLTVDAGQTVAAGPVTLTPAGILLGSVADAATGAPVAGALITLSGTAIGDTTDATGSFLLSQVSGPAPLQVTAEGYAAPPAQPVSFTTGTTTHAGVIALTRLAGTITGTVQDAAASPLAGAVVAANDTAATATTDAAGAFTLMVPAGTHTLTVRKDGLASQSAGPFAVAGTVSAGVIALAEPRGTITVQVRDADSGLPVEGVGVLVTERAIVGRTDPSGAATLTLAPGYVTLQATLGARQTQSAILRVMANQSQTVELTLPATGVVEGTVTNQEDGSPLVGAAMSLRAGQGSTWTEVATTSTDGAGHLRLEAPPGTYTLQASRAAWATGSLAPVTVVAGQTTTLGPFVVPGRGRLLGAVGGPWAPRSDHTITAAWGLGGWPGSAVLDQQHGFELTLDAVSGTSALTFTDPLAHPLSVDALVLHTGHTLEVPSVVLSMYGVLKGFVRQASGEGITGTTFTLEPTGRTATSGLLNQGNGVEAGYYKLTAPTGTYTLTSDGPEGYLPLDITNLAFVDDTTVPRDLVLQPKPGWDIASLVLDPASADPGGTATGTITLTGPAPSRQVMSEAGIPVVLRNYVRLQSSSPAVVVPAAVTFDGGVVSTTFPITIGAGAPVTVTITGTYVKKGLGGFDGDEIYPGRTGSATLTVGVPAPASLTLDPATVEPGGTSTATVTLSLPARPGGAVVTLESSDPTAATVPASLTIPEGQSEGTFTVTSLASSPNPGAVISASGAGVTRTAVLTLVRPRLTGVAPGWTLAGTPEVVAYGSGFDQGSEVIIEGPVYALGQYAVQLCNPVIYQCPGQIVSAVVNPAGTSASFTAPATLGTGLYRLTVRRSGGLTTDSTTWLAIDEAAKTVPEVLPADHKFARAIHSGQTITGTFVADGDPDHRLQDVNLYYVPGTAGSRIRVTLERVDTSKTWQHPDSLDPQLEIMTPDGFIPQNLVSYDRQPGLDLNAELANAVLPQTGLYFIYAGTSKGSGAYRLTYELLQPATVSPDQRVLPLANAFLTVPVGRPVTPSALALDPRGYRLSGARMHFATTPLADDTGSLDLSAAQALTSNPDGTIQATLTPIGPGKVTFAPIFEDGFAEPAAPAPAQGTGDGGQGTGSEAGQATATRIASIPRYQPVARGRIAITDVYGDQSLGVTASPVQKLPATSRLVRRAVRDDDHAATRSDGRGRSDKLVATGRAGATDPGPRTPDPDPLDASTAVPLPEIHPEGMASDTGGHAASLTTCMPPQFALGVVPEGTELHPPFTAVLKDLTPPGGPGDEGIVGLDGLHGHRIEKTIDLQLELHDATGQVPAYPVLVQLNLAGPNHGALLLNDGALRCDSVARLWHQRNAEGALLPDPTLRYELGQWAWYVGVLPDAASPGGVQPVWGSAEQLHLRAQAKLPDNQESDPLMHVYGVHPEPGKPEHILCLDEQFQPAGDIQHIWTGWRTYVDSQSGHRTGGMTLLDAYHVGDRYWNVVFGLTAAAATSPASNLTVQLESQLLDGEYDPSKYSLDATWEADPSWPSGSYTSTLSISYPADPDWGAGTITKDITLQLDGGTSHLLAQKQSYDRRNGQENGDEDGPLPMAVAPGAEEGALPTTTAGDTPRLVLLALAGADVPSAVETGGDEATREPHHIYRYQSGAWQYVEDTDQDVKLETADQPKFKLSLIGYEGTPIPKTSFLVHRCPRYDHLTEPDQEPESSPCSLEPVSSDGDSTPDDGVLDEIQLNPDGGGPGSRGYLGIELTKAPVEPGTYYIEIEPVDTPSPSYRIRRQANFIRDNQSDAGEFKGAFAICTVAGLEILDSDFSRIHNLDLAVARQIYLRLLDSAEGSDSVEASAATYDSAGESVSQLDAVLLTRIGRGATFLSSPITVFPPPETGWPASTEGGLSGGPGLALTASPGECDLKAKIALKYQTELKIMTGLAFDFKIGDIGRADGAGRNPGWTEPNILFGDGADFVDMSVRVVDVQGNPIPMGWHLESLATVEPAVDGVVSALQPVSGDTSRYSFTFTAPTMPQGEEAYRRPRFVFVFKDRQEHTYQPPPQTARLENDCIRNADFEQKSHCSLDPNFPMVYSRWDFRRATYFPSPGVSVTLTDDDYTSASMSEPEVQQKLVDGNSLLAVFRCIERVPGEFESSDLETGVYGKVPTEWPTCFFDLDGDGKYVEGSGDPFGYWSSRNPRPIPPAPSVTFAHMLVTWCNMEGVNPRVLLTHLQKEQGSVQGAKASQLGLFTGYNANDRGVLRKLFGVFDTNNKFVLTGWPTVQIAQGAHRARKYFDEAGREGKVPPVVGSPHHGGYLWPVYAYQWQDGLWGYNHFYRDKYDPQDTVLHEKRPTASFIQSRAAYALFKYTPIIDHSGHGSAFLYWWIQLGFSQ